VSLCNECHERMHDRLTGELTAAGERWRDRVSAQVRNALAE